MAGTVDVQGSEVPFPPSSPAAMLTAAFLHGSTAPAAVCLKLAYVQYCLLDAGVPAACSALRCVPPPLADRSRCCKPVSRGACPSQLLHSAHIEPCQMDCEVHSHSASDLVAFVLSSGMGVSPAAVTQWQAAFLLDEAARGAEATPPDALQQAAALLPGQALTPLPAKPGPPQCPPPASWTSCPTTSRPWHPPQCVYLFSHL